jgi:hypothetical protein
LKEKDKIYFSQIINMYAFLRIVCGKFSHYDKRNNKENNKSLAAHVRPLLDCGYCSCYARCTRHGEMEKKTLQRPRIRFNTFQCRLMNKWKIYFIVFHNTRCLLKWRILRCVMTLNVQTMQEIKISHWYPNRRNRCFV